MYTLQLRTLPDFTGKFKSKFLVTYTSLQMLSQVQRNASVSISNSAVKPSNAKQTKCLKKKSERAVKVFCQKRGPKYSMVILIHL